MSLTHDDLSNLCILISLLFLDYILINVKTFRQMTRFANFYGVIMVLFFIVSWQIFNVYFNFLVFLILFFVSYKIWQFKKK
ncbi:sodium:pantothenate symporter [Campylobacter jejuni]|uniref:sodium:pantothenate symporter n=1 Tax=Campylobacter jejuni TaxID=197 RepID=UPI000F80C800|nr:sodium:pantothenate symporter [Campylobacter jejuni]RTJ21305.1 sodium:pantothenate symporter [Campylobacter jejuni]RTJ75761.1 sodium:pantothenate symporter [Campylobacter jejuni]